MYSNIRTNKEFCPIPRRGIYLALLICILLATNPSYSASRITVAIQPLGTIHPAIISSIRQGIQRLYKADIIVLPPKALPKPTYYKPRKRYRAEKLLDFLHTIKEENYEKLLGVTFKDISTTKGKYYDWGIFGLAKLGGDVCVVSAYRLMKRGAAKALFNERLIKVVDHELGHSFGLPHCPTKGCIMEDAKGKIRTVDEESGEFCPRCKKQLRLVLR